MQRSKAQAQAQGKRPKKKAKPQSSDDNVIAAAIAKQMKELEEKLTAKIGAVEAKVATKPPEKECTPKDPTKLSQAKTPADALKSILNHSKSLGGQ